MKLSKRFITFLLMAVLAFGLMACGGAQTADEQTWEDPNPSVYQGEDDEWIDIDIDLGGGSHRKTKMKRGDVKAGKQNNPTWRDSFKSATPRTVTRSTTSTTSKPSSSSSTTRSTSTTSRSSSSTTSRRK